MNKGIRAEVFKGGDCTPSPPPTTTLTVSLVQPVLLSLHPSSLLVLFSIPSIRVFLRLFSFYTLHLYPSLTQSVSTQGSRDPHNPLIIGPVRLPSSHSCFHPIPSRSLCQKALQKLKILSSLVFFAFPPFPQASTSPSLHLFFSSEGKLILIIPSPLPHPSSPL